MTARHPRLSDLPAFNALRTHAQPLKNASVQQMLYDDAGRASEFCLQAADLTLDYSKQLVNREVLSALHALADEAGIAQRITDLLHGAQINITEQRPALHTLLRAPHSYGMDDKYAAVLATRERMAQWAKRLNPGLHCGYSGAAITDVVNIGIGGSDLGPRLVTEALKPFQGTVSCHYVANVDPADLQEILLDLAPETTLFIVCSKSFRTEETLTNSLAARDWLLHAGASHEDLAKHFLAVTTNISAAQEFGIDPDNCLPLWDWVGGRYSVWSAVGLSVAIAVGWEHFTQFLDGAAAMDEHFGSAPLPQNMPLLMSLLEVWYVNLMGASNHVVLPYCNSLQRLPDYLQQLTMESNGKRVNLDGSETGHATGPVLWGAAGTMGQHSFHQLLHQGTVLCPADFILPLTTHTGMSEQHQRLVSNCLAQSRAMMVGRTSQEALETLLQRGMDETQARALAPHLAMPGNRPNSIITMDALTPSSLGALLALYEHRTFCSGQLWGINPFDQWGVELGKDISSSILPLLTSSSDEEIEQAGMDAATRRLIRTWQRADESRP
mgnify:CR=1 FL=1|tara:strand:- start:28768 stop:30429 length:1662 start_codon:yes stop_codon:yes gene_type:complete